jgi:hypothetical protein
MPCLPACPGWMCTQALTACPQTAHQQPDTKASQHLHAAKSRHETVRSKPSNQVGQTKKRAGTLECLTTEHDLLAAAPAPAATAAATAYLYPCC